MKKAQSLLLFGMLLWLMIVMAACTNSTTDTTDSTPVPVQVTEAGNTITEPIVAGESTQQATTAPEKSYPAGDPAYPSADIEPTLNPAYPVGEAPLSGSPEPPNPKVELPAASAGNGTIGGVLIRKYQDDTFVPVNPYKLILATQVMDAEGNPLLWRHDENSPLAQLFETGVFIFADIPPGTYGLILNLAVEELPVKGPDGQDLFIELKPGQALDLGQIIIDLD